MSEARGSTRRSRRRPFALSSVATLLLLPLGLGASSTASAAGLTFHLDPEELVASADVRQAAGYTYGPEGVLGVVPNATPGEFTFVGSNGIQTSYGFAGRGGRITGTLQKPFATELNGLQADDNITMAHTPADIHFTAPSKIYQIPGTTPEQWLTVVHSERYFTSPATGQMHQSNGYYATLGMAKSIDRGKSWTYLGEIVKHKTTMAQCAAAGNISTEVGSGPWNIVKVSGIDYFYSYFFDKQAPDCLYEKVGKYNNFSVARARVADVVFAAAHNATTPWMKYYKGAWSQSGLGGSSTDLNTDLNWSPAWYDVSFNSYRDKYMLISTGCQPKAAHYTGDLCYRESTDGLIWSKRIPLNDFVFGFNVYPTIVGLGNLPGRRTGKAFYIYYFHTTLAQTFWTEGALYRVKVTIT